MPLLDSQLRNIEAHATEMDVTVNTSRCEEVRYCTYSGEETLYADRPRVRGIGENEMKAGVPVSGPREDSTSPLRLRVPTKEN